MKNILLPILALALIVGFGVYEAITINKMYEEFEQKVDCLIELAYEEKLTEETYAAFTDEWLALREKSEFFLPHNDVYEMTLRVAETRAYVQQEDFQLCVAQLSVMKDLAAYISHLSVPSVQHVM